MTHHGLVVHIGAATAALMIAACPAVAQAPATNLPAVNYPVGGPPAQPETIIVNGPRVWVVENAVRTEYVWYGGYWWFWDSAHRRQRAEEGIARRLDARIRHPGALAAVPPRRGALPNAAPHPIVASGPFHSAAAGPRPR